MGLLHEERIPRPARAHTGHRREHGTDATAIQDEHETGNDYDNGIQSYNRDDPAVETGFRIRTGHTG